MTKTAHLVAALLVANVPTFEGAENNPDDVKLYQEMRGAVARILTTTSPYLYGDGSEEEAINALTPVVKDLGPRKLGALLKMIAYHEAVLADMNVMIVGAMQGAASAGDAEAIQWLLRNRAGLGDAAGMLVVRVSAYNDDPKFNAKADAAAGEAAAELDFRGKANLN